MIFLVNDFFSWFRKKFAIIGITTVFKSTFFCFVPKVMNNIYRYISIELFQVFVHFLPLSFSIVFVFLYEWLNRDSSGLNFCFKTKLLRENISQVYKYIDPWRKTKTIYLIPKKTKQLNDDWKIFIFEFFCFVLLKPNDNLYRSLVNDDDDNLLFFEQKKLKLVFHFLVVHATFITFQFSF